MRSLKDIIENAHIFGYRNLGGLHAGNIKLPDCGVCSVCWSDSENGYEHVSVSPRKQYNIPSWDDMALVKRLFFEVDEEAYQIMPKESEYVNIKKNCLHIWRPSNGMTLGDIVKMK